MGLDNIKKIADIGQTITNIAGAVFDRVRKIKDLDDRLKAVEGDVRKLKEEK